jgi:hypothetical protein
MAAIEPVVIKAGQSTARLRLELAGGAAIYLDIRVTPDQAVEVAVTPPVRATLVAPAPTPAEERAAYYRTPEFRQRLVDHISQAKDLALADIEEAVRHGRP